MPIKWSRRARRDLGEIKRYIAQDSPVNARRFVESLLRAVEELEEFPLRSRAVREADGEPNVRELIFQGYRIIYLIEDQQLYVLAVLPGSRNLQAMKKKPWAPF